MAKKRNSVWIWIIIAIIVIIAVAVYFILTPQESPQLSAYCDNLGQVSCNGETNCQPAGLTCSDCPAEKPFMVAGDICSPSPST